MKEDAPVLNAKQLIERTPVLRKQMEEVARSKMDWWVEYPLQDHPGFHRVAALPPEVAIAMVGTSVYCVFAGWAQVLTTPAGAVSGLLNKGALRVTPSPSMHALLAGDDPEDVYSYYGRRGNYRPEADSLWVYNHDGSYILLRREEK